VRYGGNTSSVEVRTNSGGLLVLDAGTGIRPLGASVAAERPARIHLLLTHLHLDHVEGLGFFAPLFDAEAEITIWGPRPDEDGLAAYLARYLSPPWFPLEFETLPSQVEIVEVEDDAWELEGISVTSAPVQHRGPTLGYRLEDAGGVLAYIPDNEPALRPESGLGLAAGADVLLHDAQYTDDEYRTRVGWGHTALSDFARYVAAAESRRVLMFHHDPSHEDDQLERMQSEARALTGAHVELAHEGLEIDLGCEPEEFLLGS
jgi:phosphoribosyl 1,2-cyclic phosphodiesterase